MQARYFGQHSQLRPARLSKAFTPCPPCKAGAAIVDTGSRSRSLKDLHISIPGVTTAGQVFAIPPCPQACCRMLHNTLMRMRRTSQFHQRSGWSMHGKHLGHALQALAAGFVESLRARNQLPDDWQSLSSSSSRPEATMPKAPPEWQPPTDPSAPSAPPEFTPPRDPSERRSSI